MKSVFNENMTSDEARITLFREIEGKTKEEIETLKSAYLEILPAILEREFDLASKGWFID